MEWLILFLYLGIGLLVVFIMARMNILNARSNDDVITGFSVILFWPLVVIFWLLAKSMRQLLKLGNPKKNSSWSKTR